MSKSFIEEFKKEFSFLEEYGFVFSIDPCNPNRPCYKNNYGEIAKIYCKWQTGWYNKDHKLLYREGFLWIPLRFKKTE